MWQTVKISDVCTIKGRIGYRGYTKGDLVEPGEGAISLSPSNIISNKINFTKSTYISWEKYYESPEIMLEIDDIVFCKTASIGKLAIVENLPVETTLNPQFVVLKNISCDNRFLYYAIQSPSFSSQISGIIGGTAIPTLSQKNLGELVISLPPLSEQQRIVAKLDAAFAEIEKAKNSLEQERVRYRNFVKAAILSKLEDIDKLHVSDFEQVCDFVRGPFGGSLKKSMFVEKGFAVYEQQHPINDQFDDFRYFITDEKFSEMERFAVQPGDVLMSCSGSLGKTCIVPSSAPKGIINQALLKITPKENILAEYLQLVMRSDLFQSLIWDVSGGAAQSNVPPIKVIKKLPLPVPPVAEQKEILSWAHELMGTNLEIILDQKLKAFVQLKSAILAQELQSEAA